MKPAREMTLTVEYETDEYQRWLASVVECPEIVAYGETAEEAGANVESLARREIAKVTNQQDTIKFVHKRPEIQEVFEDALAMPYTFHIWRGSDWDVAEGPYGTVGVDVPRNPEDRSD